MLASMALFASIPFVSAAQYQPTDPYIPDVHEGNVHIDYEPAVNYHFPFFFFDQSGWQDYRFDDYSARDLTPGWQVTYEDEPAATSEVYYFYFTDDWHRPTTTFDSWYDYRLE
jgi:hypothetical protein